MRPKVAIAITNLAGGGAELVVVRLANGLLEEQFDVHIILNEFSGVLADELDTRIPVHELRAPTIGRALPSLAKTVRNVRPTFLMTHLWQWSVLGALARPRDCRLIAVEHNLRSHGAFEHGLRRFALRRADAVVAVSRGLQAALSTTFRLRPRKIVHVPNPVVPLKHYAIDAPQAKPTIQGSSPRVPRLLAMGSLRPEKRHDVFLRAVAEVSRVKPVRAAILGEGALRSDLESLRSELGLSGVVEMPGHVDPHPWLKQATAYVHTSDSEGLPTALIEAVHYGVPAVATDCPFGPREILDNGLSGILTPLGDPPSTASSILNVLEEPELALDRAAYARHFVNATYTTAASVTRYVHLLTDLVDPPEAFYARCS